MGVPERVRQDGAIDLPLDEDAMRAAARELKKAVAAIAVNFLYGFVRLSMRPAPSRFLKEEHPDAFICSGHEVAPSSASSSGSPPWC